MDIVSTAAELDGVIGRQMAPLLAKAHLAQLCKRHPHIRDEARSIAQKGGGPLVRRRADVLYGTIGLRWAAVTGEAPTTVDDIFSKGIGDNDPGLGGINLTDFFTNLEQGAKMDSSQQFQADSLGFTCQFLNAPGGLDADLQAQVLAAVWNSLSVVFKTGTQTEQLFGPLMQWPGIGIANSPGGSGAGLTPFTTNLVAAPQGYQGVRRLSPRVILGAGQTFRLALNLLAGVLPTDVALADVIVMVRGTFTGQSLTTITG